MKTWLHWLTHWFRRWFDRKERYFILASVILLALDLLGVQINVELEAGRRFGLLWIPAMLSVLLIFMKVVALLLDLIQRRIKRG